MKVYIYFLKENPKEVYAFTTLREYKEIFEEQRNMNLFYKKKDNIDKIVFMTFMNSNRNKKMIKDYINDGRHDFEVVTTMHESLCMDESCEYISNTLTTIRQTIHEYSLNEKYLNSILALTDVIKIKNNNPTLKINTFKLFYSLFKNTFYKNEDYT